MGQPIPSDADLDQDLYRVRCDRWLGDRTCRRVLATASFARIDEGDSGAVGSQLKLDGFRAISTVEEKPISKGQRQSRPHVVEVPGGRRLPSGAETDELRVSLRCKCGAEHVIRYTHVLYQIIAKTLRRPVDRWPVDIGTDELTSRAVERLYLDGHLDIDPMVGRKP